MADMEVERGSPFWRFSLGYYRQPGVSEACIALQDGCGADVNIVLFLLWLAAAKRRIGTADLKAVSGKAIGWRDDVVAPLRTVRRKLKDGSTLVERTTAELFRTKIKAVELESERLQQEALFGLVAGLATENAATVEAAARDNVAAYERMMPRSFPPDAVGILVAAVPTSLAGAGTR